MARTKDTGAAIVLAVAVVVLLAAVLGAYSWARNRGFGEPAPGEQRCVATAAGASVAVDLNQAHFASIIAGVSLRRKLPPRAASIALATVYQETDIRNLDYGDRDSVGLFQQRPSQGWGTEKQLMDPYYATGKFYDALVKIEDWETDDINDVAQKVQRSGYPEAYRDHEADARVLASTLTGRSPAGFSCLERRDADGDPDGLADGLDKTFGSAVTKRLTRAGSVVTIEAGSERLAWAYASFAVANSKTYGLVQAEVGARSWKSQRLDLPAWDDSGSDAKSTTVRLTVR